MRLNRARWLVAAFLFTASPLALAQPPAAPPETVSDEQREIVRLYQAEEYEAALALSERRLAAARAAGGRTAELAQALSDHGAILIALERHDEAEPILRDAVSVSEEARGPDHPRTLTALTNLAAGYLRAGRAADALPRYDELIARRRRVLGIESGGFYDEALVVAIMDRASARVDLGHAAAAADELFALMESSNFMLGNNALRADFLEGAFDVFQAADRLPQLVAPLERLVSQSSGDPGDADVLRQLDILRQVLVAAGRPEDAARVGLRIPSWVTDEYDRLVEADDREAAFALVGRSVELLGAECQTYCSYPALYREMLEFQSEELGIEGRAAEHIEALRQLAALEARQAQGFGPEVAARYETLADALARAGQEAEARQARLQAEVAASGAEQALGGNARLQLARRLRAGGQTGEAEAVLREEMQCGFGPDYRGVVRSQPCDSARLAMQEYADLLETQGRRADAEFFRLPQEIVTAHEALEGEAARVKAERLLTLATQRHRPSEPYYRMALEFHAAVFSWQDVPLFDIPRAFRLCGRWDEPEPPQPRQDQTATPMPMIVTTAPTRQSFSYATRPVTELDPHGEFYHSLTNRAGMSFERYVEQCRQAGRPADGLRVAEWALGEAARLGYRTSDRHRLVLAKARIQRSLGDYAGAERSYLSLVDVYLTGEDGVSQFETNVFDELMNFYAMIGRSERLLALVLRMVESAQYDNRDAQLRFRAMLFELYLGRGDLEQARTMLVNLVPLHSQIEDGSPFRFRAIDPTSENAVARRQGEILFLNQLSRLMIAEGQKDDAIALLRQAMADNQRLVEGLANDRENPRAQRLMLDSQLVTVLAGFLFQDGDYAGALAAIEEGPLGLFREWGLDTLLANASAEEIAADNQASQLLDGFRGSLATAAELALRSGQIAKASDYLDRAQRLPPPSEFSVANLQMLWTSVAFGVLDPARRPRALQDAGTLAEGLATQWLLGNRNALDASYKREALRMAPQFFGDIAALEWAARAAGDNRTGDATAFEHVQRAILDTVDLSIASSTGRRVLERTKPELVTLLDERDAISATLLARTRLNVDYDRMTIADAAGRTAETQPATPGAPTRRVVDERLNRLAAIDARLQREAPEYFALTSAEPVPLAEAQALLGADEAMLLIAPGRFGTQLMLLTSTGLDWRQSSLTLDQVATLVRRLRYSLGGDVVATDAEEEEWLNAVDGGANGFDRDTAHALYRELVAPFRDGLAGKRQLFVSASGPLTALPFAALVSRTPAGRDDDPQALRDTGWLGDDVALVQMPSLQSLALLRRYGGGSGSGGAQGLLGFGDPVLAGRARVRGARRNAETGAPAAAALFRMRGDAPVADVDMLRRLSRLDGTARELADMAEAMQPAPAALFLGDQATESQVKQTPLTGRSVIAFATHGLMTGELGVAEPGLVLTPPASGSSADDGFLSASEIASLSMDADWVILSACNTASGNGEAGATGLSGLARAFFQSGARGLLVSHWPVRDDVAARLTVLAIDARRNDPSLTKAEAMRVAMRTIRNDPARDGLVRTPEGEEVQMSWAHPNAWAPFTVISGDR